MAGETPSFWWVKTSFLKISLAPVAAIYSYFARHTMDKKVPPAIDLPVLCVGNFTLGGAGKTPVAIALSKHARQMGLKPGIVSRGYGSSYKGVHLVDPHHDRARDVGDEPLLLARHAPVAISPNRLEAAQLLQREGCTFILMDDGFQSRRLVMDYALLVVDGLRGLGNGAVFPAGPLRAPLETQLAYTDSVLVIGQGAEGDHVIRMAARAAKPLALAKLTPSADGLVADQRFLAFAGIGNPEKFFLSITQMHGIVEQTRSYADHHFFTEYDLKDIADSAKSANLHIATTAKDYIRLKTDGQERQLDNLVVFDVTVDFDDADFCKRLIEETLDRFKKRSRGF